VGREIGVNVRDEKGKAEEVKPGKGKGKEKVGGGLEVEEDNTVWLHCSVGEPMDDEEIEGEKEKIQVSRFVGRAEERSAELILCTPFRPPKLLLYKVSTD